jgi:hypothetical protein
MNYYPPAYNPNYMPMQQRLNQMEQQYPQFAQNNTNTSSIPSSSMLKGRPVTGVAANYSNFNINVIKLA